MSHDPQDVSPMFRIDVGPTASDTALHTSTETEDSSELTQILHQLLIGQERQNELLEELVEQNHASQKQRSV